MGWASRMAYLYFSIVCITSEWLDAAESLYIVLVGENSEAVLISTLSVLF